VIRCVNAERGDVPEAETADDEGPGIGKGDAAIAATALERDEPVLAGDGQFGNISGVTLETYR